MKQFQVGEVVKVHKTLDGDTQYIGQTGTITTVEGGDSQFLICVNNETWFAPEELRYLTKLDKALK